MTVFIVLGVVFVMFGIPGIIIKLQMKHEEKKAACSA
jgi:hypothetical protein